MHGDGLTLALMFLIAAVIAVPLFKRFGLGAVLGYLAAGVVLGPHGAKAIRDAGPVLTASEIGVVMLLFVIGLEMSLPRLKAMRRPIFAVGGLQVAASALLLWLPISLTGQFSAKAAWVVASALALSSTAVGLQLLAERKQLQAPHGRAALAVLLFQDIAAIPLIAAVPLLGTLSPHNDGIWWQALLKAAVAVAVLVIGGRWLLRRMFALAARIGVAELMTATALLAVLGAAWVMGQAGLSMGLGAFIAGVLLADSEYRHEIAAQIAPFESLLLGLFFMAVGMSIDIGRIADEPLLIGGAVITLLALKALVLFAVGFRPASLPRPEAVRLACTLAMGGEFAFIVFNESLRVGLLEATMRDRLVAIVGLSMALTPVLVIAANRLLPVRKATPASQPFDRINDDHPQIIIAGMGRFGQIVARILRSRRIPFTALDRDPEQVRFLQRFGGMVYFGDAAQPALLRAAGIAHAQVLVLATSHLETALHIARRVRREHPHVRVLARARTRQDAFKLMDVGTKVYRETFGSSLEMGRDALRAIGIDEARADLYVRRFREMDEKLLAEQYLVHDDEDALIAHARDAIHELEALFEADAMREREPQDTPRT
ncbi:glutathione-regulated potassium-efflux system protein KefB [Lysobacter pythonis]|uniref:Glutathione-regulated potassium-efflux system protein KefB n=1 Tax=Solilutibacter pythonis TaxID=2483112 RepID=A0A3M2HVT6_9GAMM|nr:monovalent cation:proton antiporter-2 (CPA2) family protein [Lysobacter pythonis]RMH93128.1 glutathione-regulated potassium-efflux system protein KefB [Lysobacter pythonis]